ncbi:MAG: hypothetical protein WBA22_08450 [Candidatus Methanofastidiosia archaeon]
MTGHMGIVACSAEGAVPCYRTICDDSIVVSIGESLPDIGVVIMYLFRELDHVYKLNEDMDYRMTQKNELEKKAAMIEMIMFSLLCKMGYCMVTIMQHYISALSQVLFGHR